MADLVGWIIAGGLEEREFLESLGVKVGGKLETEGDGSVNFRNCRISVENFNDKLHEWWGRFIWGLHDERIAESAQAYRRVMPCLKQSTGPKFVQETLSTTLSQLQRAINEDNAEIAQERARQALDLTKDLSYSEGE